MARRHAAEKRLIHPDAKYGSKVVTKLMNAIMLDGKKSIAERIVYNAMGIVETKAQTKALEVFYQALDNIKPQVEVRSRRIGGSTYQIPVDVSDDRRQALAIRWLVEASKKRHEHTMEERLANEIVEAFNNRGGAFKKKEDTHKMAEANKAFAHYKI